MKANVIRLFLLCGFLGLGSIHAQDATEPAIQAEASESSSSNQVTIRHSESRSPLFGLGNDVVLKSGETCPFVIVIGGNAKVDGIVDENIVVVGGNLSLNGEARQDTFVIGGNANVGPKGKSSGEFMVFGGELNRAEGATFAHPPEQIGPTLSQPVEAAWKWVTHGLLLGRPVVPSLPVVWMFIGAFFALYCLIALLFRNAEATTVQTIELHPIGSLLTGFLVLIIIGIIISILVLSVAGVFLLPFLLCGIVLATLIGKVAVYEYIGCMFFQKLRPPSLISILALTLGMVICVALCMIPFIGFLVWGLVCVLGLGSVVLACFRLLQREALATRAAFVAAPAAVPVASGVAYAGAPASAPVTAAPPIINRQPLAFPLAGFWPRAGAFVLDLIVVGGALALVGMSQLFPLGLLAYSIGFLVWRGATIGCIIAGTRCVRTNGGTVTWSYAIVRTLASILSLLPFGLGFLWAAWDPNKQTWHDKVAGTVVVKIPPTFQS